MAEQKPDLSAEAEKLAQEHVTEASGVDEEWATELLESQLLVDMHTRTADMLRALSAKCERLEAELGEARKGTERLAWILDVCHERSVLLRVEDTKCATGWSLSLLNPWDHDLEAHAHDLDRGIAIDKLRGKP